jgi:anti-sigma factor RsiW
MMDRHTDPRMQGIEAQLCDFVDGSLVDEGVIAELQAMIAADPAIEAMYNEARDARSLLTGLEPRPAPRDFLRKVQRQVRRRSGGRYFHPANIPVTYKISVEVFVVVAITVMSACWFFLEAARPKPPGPLTVEPTLHAPKVPGSTSSTPTIPDDSTP